MEPFHPPPPPHTMDNASLSIWAYLRSVLVNDRDAKATGLSLPSGMTCEKTAPMPVGEASQANLTGNAIYALSLCEDLLALFSPLPFAVLL